MADIFISYSKRDGEKYAKHVWEVLRQTGFKPFLDQRDIKAGANWMKKIDEELENSSKFLLILTSSVRDSEYVKYEFQKAILLQLDKKIRIIPFRYHTLPLPRIPDGMRQLQHIKFQTKEELARNALIQVYPEDTLSGQPIEKDIQKVQMERIFINRKPDPIKNRKIFNDLSDQLMKQISTSTISEVYMLGISFRDFFGKDTKEWKVLHNDIITNAFENNVQFKVLLLDPTSEAAKERAKIEIGQEVESDKKYIKSPLFDDIKRVTTWLDELNSPLIEVRYSTLRPFAYMIRTDFYSFIEQYHLGNLKKVKRIVKSEDKKSLCLGGYVPFFMLKNTSSFARIMKSHFENIWEMMKKNTLSKVIEEIEKIRGTFEEYNVLKISIKIPVIW